MSAFLVATSLPALLVFWCLRLLLTSFLVLFVAIQKLFGESTPAGLEWQFRDIKKLGKAQQAAVAKGESPINVMGDVMGKRSTGSAYSTPSGRASKHAPAPTPGSRASTMTATPGGGASRKRKQTVAPKYADLDSNEVSDDDSDYDSKDTELESTPSRKRNRLANASAGGAGAVGGNSATPTRTNSNNNTYVNDTNLYSTGNGSGTQLFATARQSIEPTSASASTAGYDSPRQARVNISPRKDIPSAHEVIDLSGGSPEEVDPDSPMSGAAYNHNLSTYDALPPHGQPHQQSTKKTVVKPEFPLASTSSQSTNAASFTSSHATSGKGSAAAAFSFDGTRDDPFAGFDGYAHSGVLAYDHGRPASDDEC